MSTPAASGEDTPRTTWVTRLAACVPLVFAVLCTTALSVYLFCPHARTFLIDVATIVQGVAVVAALIGGLFTGRRP
ncbi:hypothetical protein ACIGDI_39665 [Streptomyces sp. NPDC085900]|uniref:hypothetical protein n=1 Tax=Streptomyces sp. NPDC085900 TaxID=3365737 RepID=UPI0037D32C5E